MILNLKDLKSIKTKQEIIAKDKKINSFLSMTNTPEPRPHVFLQGKKISNNKKFLKDNQTNTDLISFKNHFLNKRRVSSGKNLIDIVPLKNIMHPYSSNFSVSYLNNKKKITYKNNDIEINNNIIKSINFKNNNSIDILNTNKHNNNRLKKIKNKIMIDSNFSLKKRFQSINYKNINNYNNSINNFQNKTNKNDNKSFEIIHNKLNRRKNLTDNGNNLNYNGLKSKKKIVKKKINTFFNNKYLQENTDIFRIGKFFKNKNDLNIKFSLPRNYKTNNIIVDNNISLENTFKEQTVSNFNNKYYFKFKTNNLKEKETIKKLFLLLKKHKNSELDKNNDFLVFHLYKQKKMRKREINKAILEEFTSPCAYIGRNYDNGFINKEYYTNKNDYETSIIQKQKENKMISIKSLQMNI
jgi:hypothetical protein